MACSCDGNCSSCRRKGGTTRRKKNAGGYLTGPSHEQGGIPATLQHGGEIELEGGEYIINAQTVNAVGTEFLDELNSTATSYHQGGYNPGELPNPSNYRRGGRVKRKKRGGRIKKQYGGSAGNGVRTNLQTSGGEYTCLTNNYPGCGDGINGTYVGSMHYHPDKGYMAGAQHSEQSHPILQRVNNTNGRNRMPSHYGNETNRMPTRGRRTRRRRQMGGTRQMVDMNGMGQQMMSHPPGRVNILPVVQNPEPVPPRPYRKGGGTRKRKYQTGGHTHSMPITSIEHYHQQTDGPITSGMTTAVPSNPINDSSWPGAGRYMSESSYNPYPVYANTIGTGTGGDTLNSFPTGHTGDHSHPGRLGNTTRTGMNGNGPGPSTSHPPYRSGPRRAQPQEMEPRPNYRMQTGGSVGSSLVYEDTGQAYGGDTSGLINQGGYYWTTEAGVKTSNSRKVVHR
jgi:hypothetical protein